MRRYEILVFITGSATLVLEVLASRIMTPYFGVSLYIWAGILSITLTFLAVGYRYGGIISQRLKGNDLEARLLETPVISAAAILGATLLYPIILPQFSRIDLVVGSFVGATLLLALPLIALSAMNPLLIGFQRHAASAANAGGDAGSGRVFFISTVGSVLGVLITAFVVIPNLTNYRAMLAAAIVLTLSSLGFGLAAPGLAGKRRRLVIQCAVVGIASLMLFVFKDAYLAAVSPAPPAGIAINVRGEYTSIFGNIKVVDVVSKESPDQSYRMFVQDGLIQNRSNFDNVSISLYTHALEALTHGYAPEAKDVLVLGLGAGIVPRNLKRDGIAVSVVEINPDALKVARDHFGLDTQGITIHTADARTYVRGCARSFDAAVVDLFQGDNTPDYLLTLEFFRDLAQCIRPGGAVIMNAFLNENNEAADARLYATVQSAFPRVFRFGLPGGNAFIVGTSGADAKSIPFDSARVPPQLIGTLTGVIASKRPILPEYFVNFQPVSDDHNIFSVLFVDAQMRIRQMLATQLPQQVLVN